MKDLKRLLVLNIFFLAAVHFSSAVDIYWENPEVISSNDARFHKTASGGDTAVAVWHEFLKTDDENGIVYLSLAATDDGQNWSRTERFAGPFPYTGNEVPICSAAVDNKGTIFIAVSSADNAVKIFISNDLGKSFREVVQKTSFNMTVGPRLFIKEDGSPILFVTRESGNNLSIFYSVSDSLYNWSDFNQLAPEPGFDLNFLPSFASRDGVEYVVYQSFIVKQRSTYQLFMKKSFDGGRTWGEAVSLSEIDEVIRDANVNSDFFDNQRPGIKVSNDELSVVWERRYLNDKNPQIYLCRYTLDGIRKGDLEKISAGGRSCNYPVIIDYRDKELITWFDNRMGDYRIVAAEFTGIFWQDRDLSPMNGNSIFGQPLNYKDTLFIFWENRQNNNSRLILLSPDTTVGKPVIRAVNFQEGVRSSNNRFAFTWTLPSDASGIAGFSYSYGTKADGAPPEKIKTTAAKRKAEITVRDDDDWYFYVSAVDYAGNWSEPAVMKFTRDTVPPGKVIFNDPELDDNNYLTSNTFRIDWIPPSDEEAEGYSYRLDYVNARSSETLDEYADSWRSRKNDDVIRTRLNAENFSNIDNGVWAFTVSAIDEAGNMGEGETYFFKTNKYVPVTYITRIKPVIDALERVNVRIEGRGFSVGGDISAIILDKDGKEPWDNIYYLENNEYSIKTDRVIEDFTVTDVDEGMYRIGLIHPRRGLYFSKPIIKLEPGGTVKYGYFKKDGETAWKPAGKQLFAIDGGKLLFWGIILIFAVVLMFSIIRLKAVFEESRRFKKDIDAIMRGTDIKSISDKERLKRMKKRGISLRIKFTLFVIAIVLAVVVMVALPLGRFMLDTQKRNLLSGLKQQASVLLESLNTGASSFLPASNTLELGLLPDQRTAMDDAVYVTITGKSIADKEGYDYLWASDDQNIYSKLDSDRIVPGQTLLKDSISPLIPNLEYEINQRAAAELSGFVAQIEELGKEARSIALRGGNDERLTELQNSIRELDSQLQKGIKDIGKTVRSYPEFNTESKVIEDRTYIFYKPVIYRRTGDKTYYKGLVRLAVSTARIIDEIENSSIDLIKRTLVIAALAISIGIIGSLILSAIIISPINKLMRGVETIRDTEDKEELKGFMVDVKTRDELDLLAQTINQMKDGLVKAAVANKDLIGGKDIQKNFIPLEKVGRGKKSTGSKSTDNIDIFCYYEGAKGVSGDYIDYIELDDEYAVFIKCDVSGKGVPAALIMVEVATLFRNHFKNWDRKISLKELIAHINDLIEEREFIGRFAAFILVLMNVKTGECWLSNAGDSLVHVYDRSQGKMKTLTLPECPAAGPIATFMMESKITQIKYQLNKGDALFLFTDGIEESQSWFRNENFDTIKIKVPPKTEDSEETEDEFEEFSVPRILDIINRVWDKSEFKLEKYHYPIKKEELSFDFSSCEGSLEDAVLALLSVERIFRIFRDPSASDDNKIILDKKVDGFLQKTFDQYRKIFEHRLEGPEQSEYVEFSHIREDSQFDDLTIMAIRRK